MSALDFAPEDPDLAARQREHWQDTYRTNPGMYGFVPSAAATHAARIFGDANAKSILELAAGHGRDTLHFAQRGFAVSATDFSEVAIEQIRSVSETHHLTARISAIVHDLRQPLPFESDTIDAIYGHMAFCMALSTTAIHALMSEARRVLRPGGTLVYTVRHTGDAHYGAGRSHGDDIFEQGGFAVHFFSRQLVEALAEGWLLADVHPFEEGDLPRRLWRVTATKPHC